MQLERYRGCWGLRVVPRDVLKNSAHLIILGGIVWNMIPGGSCNCLSWFPEAALNNYNKSAGWDQEFIPSQYLDSLRRISAFGSFAYETIIHWAMAAVLPLIGYIQATQLCQQMFWKERHAQFPLVFWASKEDQSLLCHCIPLPSWSELPLTSIL